MLALRSLAVSHSRRFSFVHPFTIAKRPYSMKATQKVLTLRERIEIAIASTLFDHREPLGQNEVTDVIAKKINVSQVTDE